MVDPNSKLTLIPVPKTCLVYFLDCFWNNCKHHKETTLIVIFCWAIILAAAIAKGTSLPVAKMVRSVGPFFGP